MDAQAVTGSSLVIVINITAMSILAPNNRTPGEVQAAVFITSAVCVMEQGGEMAPGGGHSGVLAHQSLSLYPIDYDEVTFSLMTC